MGFSCVICITTDTKGTERKKTGIMQYPKGLMLRKKAACKKIPKEWGPWGWSGVFILFFQLLLHEAGFTADLDGNREQGQGGHKTPYPLMSPFSFVLELYLHLSPSRRRTHTSTTGRRDGTAKNGGVWRPRGNNTNTTTYLCYLPTYLAFQTFLPAFADRPSY